MVKKNTRLWWFLGGLIAFLIVASYTPSLQSTAGLVPTNIQCSLSSPCPSGQSCEMIAFAATSGFGCSQQNTPVGTCYAKQSECSTYTDCQNKLHTCTATCFAGECIDNGPIAREGYTNLVWPNCNQIICAAGYSLVDNHCLLPCSPSNECASNHYCSGGFCKEYEMR